MKAKPATYSFFRPDCKTITAQISFGVSRLQLARKLIHEIQNNRRASLMTTNNEQTEHEIGLAPMNDAGVPIENDGTVDMAAERMKEPE